MRTLLQTHRHPCRFGAGCRELSGKDAKAHANEFEHVELKPCSHDKECTLLHVPDHREA